MSRVRAACLLLLLSVSARAAGPLDEARSLQIRAQNTLMAPRAPARAALDRTIEDLRRAQDLYGRHLDHEAPEHSEVLHLLGAAYELRGVSAADLAEAQDAYRKVLQRREKALLRSTETYAAALESLAGLQSRWGQSMEAEAAYQRLLILQEQVSGADHISVARTLQHLSRIALDLGDLDGAERSQRRALAIAEGYYRDPTVGTARGPRVAPPPPTELLRYALNLGALLFFRGRHEEAAVLLVRTRGLAGDRLSPQEHAGVEHFLGAIAQAEGRYPEARQRFRQALSLLRGLGAGGEDQAAGLHLLLGEFAVAEALSRRLLEEGLLQRGPDSREAAAQRLRLAEAVAARGRVDEAAALLRQSVADSERRLRRERFALVESRLQGYLQRLRDTEEALLYTLLLRAPVPPALARLGLGAALLRKGRGVDELGALGGATFEALGPEGGVQLQQLRALRARYAGLSLAGPAEGDAPGRFAQQLTDLAQQAEALEERLLRQGARRPTAASLPGDAEEAVRRVAAALPEGEALVEWVLLRPRESAVLGAGPAYADERYLGMVLQRDGALLLRDLGPAGPIHQAAQRLRRAAADRDSPLRSGRAAAEELARLVLAPLMPALRGRRALYLSPDGPLNLIPFALLPDPDTGELLIDRYRLSYLTSGRDLLAPAAEARRPAREAVVVADPDFLGHNGIGGPGATSRRDRQLEGLHFPALPGTRREAEAIAQRLPGARLLLGAAATEDAMLSLAPPPGVLHVATHGVFFDGEVVSPLSIGRGVLPLDVPAPNPLLRSALVLAGAQQAAPSSGLRGLGRPDGLATALEVAGMNLFGTQLVVLSACETGRGEAPRGEGVYGMRRAVMVAGAETLVTSLWRVDDAVTQELMTGFYDALVAGLGRAEALQRASQAVRRAHPHPYFWAPFISLGRVEPLQGLPAGEARRPAPLESAPSGDLRAAWVSQKGRVYVAGAGGALWRHDGQRWEGGALPGAAGTLRGLWGQDGDREQVYAVGDHGLVLRVDGRARVLRGEALPAATKEHLTALWGDGQGRLYAVGHKGVVLRYEGPRVTTLPSGTTENLFGIWGQGERLTVVGARGTVLQREGGGPLRALPPPDEWRAPPHLFGVYGAGTALYVGGSGLWRWQEGRWQGVPLPDTQSTLRALTGNGPTELFVTGFRARLRGDGTRWERLPLGTKQDLRALAAAGPGQVVGVGDKGLVQRWDGRRWQRLAGPEDDPWDWQAAWGSGPADLWVAGEHGEIRRFDGQRWQVSRAGSGDSITSLWGSGPADIYAVGSRGLVLHYDGATWAAQQSATRRHLSGVWSSSAQDVYIVGEEGTVLHGDGAKLAPVPGQRDAELVAVWGSGPRDVHLAGYRGAESGVSGVLLRGDARRGFRPQAIADHGALLALWGSGANEVYAVGAGVSLRFDGRRWRPMAGAASYDLHAVWGRGPGQVYAAGRHKGVEGLLLRLVGQKEAGGPRWEPVKLPGRGAPLLLGLWGASATELLVAGWGGTALRVAAP